MTPDFWIFLPFPITRNETHSVAGLLWFCVPVGLLAYLLFHTVLKQPLLSLLPAKYATRVAFHLAQRPNLPRVPFSCVLVSLMVGSLTHLLWDLFTHWQSRPDWLPALFRETGLYLGHPELDGLWLLQDASTAFGLLLIVWWSWRWLRSAADPESTGIRLPGMLTTKSRCYVALAVLGVMPAAALAKAISLPPWQSHSVPAAIAALQGFVWALIAYSLLWQLWRMRRNGAGA